MTPRVDPDPVSRGARADFRLGLLVLAVGALVAYLSTVAIGGSPFASHYRVTIPLADGGPILKPGDEVRLGGERAGVVRSVRLVGQQGRATLELDKEKLGRGAAAVVRPRGIAGAVYVQLDQGDMRRPLASGSSIPATSSVQISDVVASFGRSARAAVARTLSAYGGGVAGQGTDLNRSLAQTPETLAALTPELRSLSRPPGQLSGLTSSAAGVADAFAPESSDDLGQAVSSAAATFSATGAASAGIAGAENELPGLERQSAATLPAAQGLLASLGPTARRLAPGVQALAHALPDARALEARAPDLDAFARLAAQARPLIDSSTPIATSARGP
ncbi:MAG TPA: MlaD family protein, partial [Thermoleophilaceae bacterium]